MTNGAGLAASPILACRSLPGEADPVALALRSVSGHREARGRGDACRAPRPWHRGVLRIVMLVASDPTGFDLRPAAPPSPAVARLGAPVVPGAPRHLPEPAAGCGKPRSGQAPGPASGPVRRGWDDWKDDPMVISVTVAVRPAVP